jgi:hypothetical protein
MNKYKVKVIDKDFKKEFGVVYPSRPANCQICGHTFNLNLYGSSPTSFIVYEVALVNDTGGYQRSSVFDTYVCSEACANIYIFQNI